MQVAGVCSGDWTVLISKNYVAGERKKFFMARMIAEITRDRAGEEAPHSSLVMVLRTMVDSLADRGPSLPNGARDCEANSAEPECDPCGVFAAAPIGCECAGVW